MAKLHAFLLVVLVCFAGEAFSYRFLKDFRLVKDRDPAKDAAYKTPYGPCGKWCRRLQNLCVLRVIHIPFFSPCPSKILRQRPKSTASTYPAVLPSRVPPRRERRTTWPFPSLQVRAHACQQYVKWVWCGWLASQCTQAVLEGNLVPVKFSTYEIYYVTCRQRHNNCTTPKDAKTVQRPNVALENDNEHIYYNSLCTLQAKSGILHCPEMF